VRDGAPDELFTGFIDYQPTISAWLNDELLTADIPVISGRATWSRSQQVMDGLSFTVPRWDRGVDYLPGKDPEHPLAQFGQRLCASITVRSMTTGLDYTTDLGWFPIQTWTDEGDVVKIEAKGLLQLAADDKLLAPIAPRTAGTLMSEFRRLLPDGLRVSFDPALVDRAVPQTVEWAEDRLASLYEIVDSWPARLLVLGDGSLHVAPPLPDVVDAVVTLEDGARGTLVGAPSSGTREGIYNVVVVRSRKADSPQQAPVQAVATAPRPSGMFAEIPAITGIIPSRLTSDVLEAQAVADATIRAGLRLGQTLPVECAPDPRIELDDGVLVQKGFLETRGEWDLRERGYVTGVDLPLTADDGSMRIDVGIV